MKRTCKYIIFNIALIALGSFAIAATHSTQNSGNWIFDETWVDNSPGYTLGNNTAIIIHAGHNVFTSEDQSLVVNGNNPTPVDIYGTLTINGSLNVSGNNLQVNVHPGGEFNIYGDVTLSNNAFFEVNGDMFIDGDIYAGNANNVIFGDGNVIITGTIYGNVDISNGTNVISTSICPPYNSQAEVNFDNYDYTISLTWQFDNTCEPERFEVKRDGNLIGIINFSILTMSFGFMDDTGLTAGSTPLYEIYAVYANGLKSTSDFVSFLNNPLPIELLHFTAEAQSNLVNIHWATAAEINNDFFTIEHSIDGSNWDILTFVQGAGNSNHTLQYKYEDENPVEGVSYYRLKQTDFDGKYEYFAPVAVNYLNSNGKMEILNVTTNSFGLNVWFRNQDPQAVITVFDIYGRVLFNGNAAVSGFAEQLSIDFPRNYNGEIIAIRLQGQQSFDEKKLLIR